MDNTMINEIREAETRADEVLNESRKEAMNIISEAEKEAKNLMEGQTEKDRFQLKKILDDAEQLAQIQIEDINKKADEKCAQIAAAAELKMKEAVDIIKKKVVE